MAVLKGFPPSSSVTSYGFNIACSETYGDYSQEINEKYDEYFHKFDEYIASKRMIKEDPPLVDDKFSPYPRVDGSRQPKGTSIGGIPMIRQSTTDDTGTMEIAELAGLPPDLLPFHDAIFMKDEDVPEIELQMPLHKKCWWDSDVIEEEFSEKPGMWSTVEEKVAYYLK